jgi:hypothetical protein
MTINRSQDVAKAVEAALKTIKKGAVFETSIGERVYRGKRNFSEDQMPCCALYEGADTVESTGTMRQVKLRQRYIVGAYTKCDPDHPNDAAHAAIRDIKRAIFKDAKGIRVGDQTLPTSYQGKDIGARADSVPVVYVTVDFDIIFSEELHQS